MIESNPDDWNAVRRGIEATGLSAAYLSVRFREALGMPMRSFALWMKYEHGCQLVLGGMSPGEASIEAGFADQSHMGRAARRFAKKSFKRAVGELAQALRNEPWGSADAAPTNPLLTAATMQGSSGSSDDAPASTDTRETLLQATG